MGVFQIVQFILATAAFLWQCLNKKLNESVLFILKASAVPFPCMLLVLKNKQKAEDLTVFLLWSRLLYNLYEYGDPETCHKQGQEATS